MVCLCKLHVATVVKDQLGQNIWKFLVHGGDHHVESVSINS